MKPLLIATILIVAMAIPAQAEPSKEARVKTAFQEAGIPPTGQHPAMLAFSICLQRKATTREGVVSALHRGELKSLTRKQVEDIVSIAEDIWCPTTSLA